MDPRERGSKLNREAIRENYPFLYTFLTPITRSGTNPETWLHSLKEASLPLEKEVVEVATPSWDIATLNPLMISGAISGVLTSESSDSARIIAIKSLILCGYEAEQQIYERFLLDMRNNLRRSGTFRIPVPMNTETGFAFSTAMSYIASLLRIGEYFREERKKKIENPWREFVNGLPDAEDLR